MMEYKEVIKSGREGELPDREVAAPFIIAAILGRGMMGDLDWGIKAA